MTNLRILIPVCLSGLLILANAKANGGVLDEDMVASVLGHEMGHNVRRHGLMSESTGGSITWILEHLADIDKNATIWLSCVWRPVKSEMGLPAFRTI